MGTRATAGTNIPQEIKMQDTERRTREDKPVVAICYDFDKTLSPDNMQAQGYLQAINYENQNEFWKETMELALSHEMDSTLAWMYLMLRGARGKEIFRREMLERYGAGVELYKGVAGNAASGSSEGSGAAGAASDSHCTGNSAGCTGEGAGESWFARMRRYGEERGIIVEHYIISSGLREMIEGTEIAGEFEKIYASSFFYDEDGVAVWPAQVVNFTNKTQFLFRISKGVLGINDDGVNDYFAPDEMRVPFRNMVYIGDSDTDIPCMKLVNSYGGHSIGVYDPDTENKARVQKMMRENRIRYYAPADYTEGSELDRLMLMVLDKTAAAEKLENVYYEKNRESGSGAE